MSEQLYSGCAVAFLPGFSPGGVRGAFGVCERIVGGCDPDTCLMRTIAGQRVASVTAAQLLRWSALPGLLG